MAFGYVHLRSVSSCVQKTHACIMNKINILVSRQNFRRCFYLVLSQPAIRRVSNGIRSYCPQILLPYKTVLDIVKTLLTGLPACHPLPSCLLYRAYLFVVSCLPMSCPLLTCVLFRAYYEYDITTLRYYVTKTNCRKVLFE